MEGIKNTQHNLTRNITWHNRWFDQPPKFIKDCFGNSKFSDFEIFLRKALFK